MRKRLSAIVPEFLRMPKEFDITIDAIIKAVRERPLNGFSESANFDIADFGYVVIRLNVTGDIRHKRSWSVSLKLDGQRFDGIDGQIHDDNSPPFHRHVWDNTELNCSRQRVPIDVLGNIASLEYEDFLSIALREMKVVVEGVGG